MNKVRTPLFPTFSEVKKLLRIFEGVPKPDVRAMLNEVYEQTGTPQNPVDWTDPKTWIPERLKGTSRALAARIWQESDGTVNPRHVSGAYMFINNFELLEPDSNSTYRLSERGQAFLKDEPGILRELDDAEGMLELLAILSSKSAAKRADLIPDWAAFLKEHSKYGTDSTTADTLRRRLVNLADRGLITRDGNSYSLSPDGLAYLSSVPAVTLDPKRELQRTVDAFNLTQREALRARLEKMHPYRFEHLVSELLEAMGYEDVTVTKQSGDKGVDVVATVQFGITTITEVVQVKRYKGNIHRDEIDKLRGALVYQKAIRGTLITLGGFSKGCAEASVFPGAAPIGLIDGEKLLELLERHEIGIQRRTLSLLELDEDVLSDQVTLEDASE
jgi:restriction system protein